MCASDLFPFSSKDFYGECVLSWSKFKGNHISIRLPYTPAKCHFNTTLAFVNLLPLILHLSDGPECARACTYISCVCLNIYFTTKWTFNNANCSRNTKNVIVFILSSFTSLVCHCRFHEFNFGRCNRRRIIFVSTECIQCGAIVCARISVDFRN